MSTDRNDYNAAFAQHTKSKFRSRFRLSDSDRQFVARVDIESICRHCAEFARDRLAPMNPPNDSKLTPMCVHPIFKVQHACACCCRGCLEK